ncbi:hypothetical protein SAMN04488028_10498 [Reichenbachiella agariperforans]|uniref:Uncharacterized protein n=1 Tax=Reichenbachiella agariperforans TaxID=156994 RepID=A0A1M6RAT1_REIAG|nr:hypothetical protein SAMN04488028_10498 [Reichenbachiella agariperforans]
MNSSIGQNDFMMNGQNHTITIPFSHRNLFFLLDSAVNNIERIKIRRIVDHHLF